MSNLSNNIFNYATSELSQDAFICYLLSFAIKDNNKDDELYKCSLEFINKMLPSEAQLEYGEKISEENIKKQYVNIDIYLKAKDYHIIIEDKTYTGIHNNQISRYEQTLIDKGVNIKRIIKVFYKIVEQSKHENVDFEFNRQNILEILDKYYEKTNDKIFKDYVDYLKSIDISINKWKSLPIAEWNNNWDCYIGFFDYLMKNKNEILTFNNWEPAWHYVSNPKGGFMGFHWSPNYISKLYEKCKSELYLQIENDKIVLKVANDDLDDKNERTIIDNRNIVKSELKEIIRKFSKNIEISKKISVCYSWVSICSIGYTENDYKEKIKEMEDLFALITKKYN